MLIAKGFHQRLGIDYNETFSHVVKPTAVRLILTITLSFGWSLHQVDNNAFLHGHLTEDVFMVQPPRFLDQQHPSHVCKLRKSLYGLKQAPRAWYRELHQFVLSMGFDNSLVDTSLFIYNNLGLTTYLLVYVDDLILTGNNDAFLMDVISKLANQFSIKDLGNLSFFLGVEVIPTAGGLFLSQHMYIRDLLEKAKMEDAKPISSLMSTSQVLTLRDGVALTDLIEYQSLIGGLQYLSLTRPDIAFSVSKLSQFMHRLTSTHWTTVKRLLRYLVGTSHHGLFFYKASPLRLYAYSDAGWASNLDDRSSTSAYVMFLAIMLSRGL